MKAGTAGLAWLAAFSLGLAISPAHAQETEKEKKEGHEAHAGHDYQHAAMEAWTKASTPTERHANLAKLAGSWATTVKLWMDPSGEPMVTEGTMENRLIMGGRFLEGKLDGSFMGQPFNGYWLLGYNNVTEQHESIWVDNHGTGIYLYTGSSNEAGDEMTLRGKYKDPVTQDWVETRSLMKIVSPDEIQETVWEKRGDQEVRTMEIVYRRN